MFRREDTVDGRKVKVLFDKNEAVTTITSAGDNSAISTINPK